MPKLLNINTLFVVVIALLISVGCTPVSIPSIKPIADSGEISNEEVRSIIKTPPGTGSKLKAAYSPFPADKVTMPKAGDKSVYGFTVTEDLEIAYQAYLSGDGDKAIAALDKAAVEAEDPGLQWQVSFFKAQVLLMMGKGADAELELESCAKKEAAYLGYDLNTIALRGEIKVWLEDFDGAVREFAKVIRAIGTWELPISYMSFPTNREHLYALATAKIRAYTALTGVYMLQEDYEAAYIWAQETERLANNVHFVNNHPLYGAGDSVHADSYYGRALNLSFFASASLAVNKNMEKAEELFKSANSFYDAFGYTVGKVNTATFRARIFNKLGIHELCYDAGQEAMKMAIERNLPDYVWRIGILTGKTLLELGDQKAAEKAFRQAQSSVELISGSLSSDHSKTRFGVGKDDITYHLAKIDIQNANWNLLFEDLERGRARSFVDMLRNRPIIKNRQQELMTRISDIDAEIRGIRLKNLSPGKPDPTMLDHEKSLINKRIGLVSDLRQKDPGLADLVSVSTTGLSEVQGQLGDGEAIAYFIPSKNDEKIQFLKIEKDQIELIDLFATYGEIREKIDSFANAFFEYDDDIDRGIFLKEREQEAEEEISPDYVIGALKQAFQIEEWGVRKNLYIVPTGILHFMPWGALDTSYPISTLPTGDWLVRNKGAALISESVTIVGDPEFGGELPQLPGAREEAISLGQLFKVQPLIGKQATVEKLREESKKTARVLHFATHGKYDPFRPLDSALYLTNGNKSLALTAKSLYEQPITANLVVLSACETGLGKTISGDDLLGLTRSFYLGGANSVLSSLWEIDDAGTKDFMLKFHEIAARGDYGKAWLEAKSYVKEKGYDASVYAAFNLSGAVR